MNNPVAVAAIPILGRTPAERIDGTRAGRVYRWKDQSFPSVTSILSNGVPKPALLPWGIKMVAEAAVELTQSGELAALVAFSQAAALTRLKAAPYQRSDDAAGLGSAVHAAAEAHILGTPMPVTAQDVSPYLAQFRRFLDKHQPEYLAAECTVYNRQHGYAGTIDAVVHIGGDTCILDYKSGRDVYPDAALQLAAYRWAEFIGLPDGRETPMFPADGALVLHLRPDGYRLFSVDTREPVFEHFIHALHIAQWQNGYSKHILKEY